MRKLTLALVLGPLLAIGLVLALILAGLTTGVIGVDQPSRNALADIPATYLATYQAAADTCANLSWPLLAGIGKEETDHGRLVAPGVTSGANFAGAAGPMQIGVGGKAGNTWARYAVDGNRDGVLNVYDPADAIFTAARYLCDNGVRAGDVRRGIFAYNHADWYVNDVMANAARYAAAPPVAGGGSAAALLGNPRLGLTPNARYDLQRDAVDPRIVAILDGLLHSYTLKCSVFITGHSLYVHGTAHVSNHIPGRAVDIFEVNGVPVSRDNPAALAVVAQLVNDTGPLRPDEIGSPFAQYEALPGAFTNADHLDHIHLGFDR